MFVLDAIELFATRSRRARRDGEQPELVWFDVGPLWPTWGPSWLWRAMH